MAPRGTAIAALGAALVLALPGVASADWPVYGHDLANTRSAGSEGPAASAVAGMQRAWTFKSPNGDFTGTPVVAGGTLVAGSNLGSIYALDAVTGKLRWSREVGQQINGSAAIDLDAPGGPTVFVPVAQIGSPRLLALSLRTGEVRWDATLTRQADADVFGSPVYWNGTVYMGTSGPNNDEATARGSVVALDEATGRMRWQTFTVPPAHDGGAVWSTPAIDVATGRLYVGTGNAYHEPAADTTDAMLALSTSTGQILGHFQATPDDVWELNSPTSGPDADIGASANLITAPDGEALVGEGSKSGTYWALDRATMKPAWNTMVGPGSQVGGILASTAYDGSRVYGTDTIDSGVWALGRDGASRWSSTDGGSAEFAPVALANGVLYSSSSSGILTARNASDGSVLAKLPLDGPAFGGVSAVGRAVYATTGTGPPLQLTPEQPDTSSADGSGSIIAFGDTSASGASPTGSVTHPGSPPRRSRAAITLSAWPHRVKPRHLTVFRFRARRGSRPLAGALVRLAGHRARTNRRGRATMRARLPREGSYMARASRRGLGSGATTIVAGQPARRPPPQAGGGSQGGPSTGRAASTFQGRCDFSGTVQFQPALTNSPQPVAQRVQATGTCSGSFVDDRRRQHDLAGEPVTYLSTGQAAAGSCLAGTATGSGALVFQYGQVRFEYSETRPAATPLLTYKGADSGSATTSARPAADQDPAAAVQQCGGAGMREFRLDGSLATTPSMSG